MEGLERVFGDVLARYGVVAAQAASVAVERENEQFALRHENLVRAIAGIPTNLEDGQEERHSRTSPEGVA